MKKYSQSIFIAAGALLALFLAIRVTTFFLDRPVTGQAMADDEPVLTSTDMFRAGQGDAKDAGVFQRVASTPPPALTAHAAMVVDPSDGEVLFNLNPNMRWPLASLTKLMTATIIRKNMDLSGNITLEASDFTAGGNSHTVFLVPGDTYKAADLLKIMLVSSSNEAAEAFARIFGRDAFLAAMNSKAAEWGLMNTHFVDPSGLSIQNQSTPMEYKELALHVWREDPEFFADTREASVGAIEQNSGAVKYFSSTDDFAGRSDFLGGKTGTTPEAGENLLALFSYRSHPVMILILGSDDRFKETERLYQWFTHDFSPGN